MAMPTLQTPYVEVAPPSRRPLRGGLFDAIGAESIHDLDRLGAGGAGVMYLSDRCNFADGTYPAPCTADVPPSITSANCAASTDALATTTPSIVWPPFGDPITCECAQRVSYGQPFTLWTSVCVNPLEDASTLAARAQDNLARAEWRGLERILSSILPGSADDVTPQACHCGITAAVAALEGVITSCYDGQGIIHAPAYAASYLMQQRLIADDTSTYPLQTVLGTRFALGGGYTGAGPKGEVATDCTFWMYVTPAVDVYRGKLTVPVIQDTDHNTTMAVAEQPHAITVDCGGIYGARVNIDPCACPCAP